MRLILIINFKTIYKHEIISYLVLLLESALSAVNRGINYRGKEINPFML